MKNPNQTKGKIIIAALQLFVRQGYHGTSIDDITKSVGVTKGAFYAHFKSKREILIRLLEEYKLNFLDELIRTVNAHNGDAHAKLHRLVSFNAQFGAENLELIVFLSFVSHELTGNSDFEFAFKSIYREYEKFLSDLIRSGINQGLFQKDLNPDYVALNFIAMQDGVLHHWVLNRNRLDGRQFVRTMRHIFIKGIGGR